MKEEITITHLLKVVLPFKSFTGLRVGRNYCGYLSVLDEDRRGDELIFMGDDLSTWEYEKCTCNKCLTMRTLKELSEFDHEKVICDKHKALKLGFELSALDLIGLNHAIWEEE